MKIFILLITLTSIVIVIDLLSFRTFKKVLVVGSLQRHYFLHLPAGYDQDKYYPLVVMLHGYSDSPRLMELYTGMSKKADKEGFMVVYPEGTHDTSDKRLSWNVGFCCGGARRQQVNDVAFINALLDELPKQYSIDTKRIYVAGFSNGAMLAHKVGTELSSKVTAIAAVAGAIGGTSISIVKPLTSLPVLIMHGTADRTVPFHGGKNKDGDIYVSVVDAVSFWEENNQSVEPVLVYTIDGGTHRWFGGEQEFLKNIFGKSVSATNTVWDFFKTKSRSLE